MLDASLLWSCEGKQSRVTFLYTNNKDVHLKILNLTVQFLFTVAFVALSFNEENKSTARWRSAPLGGATSLNFLQ